MLFKGPKSLLESISNIIKEDRVQYAKEQAEMDRLVAEKILSPKQKKIAAVAGDPGKIDAADFAALRAGKQVKEDSETAEKPFKYNKKTGTFDRVKPKKMEEEVEPIDELSKGTLSRYIKSASGNAVGHGYEAGRKRNAGIWNGFDLKGADAAEKKAENRVKGISTAVKKLNKEEVEHIYFMMTEGLGDYIKGKMVGMSGMNPKEVAHTFHKSMVKSMGDKINHPAVWNAAKEMHDYVASAKNGEEAYRRTKDEGTHKKILQKHMSAWGHHNEEVEQIDEKAKWRSSSAAEPNPKHQSDVASFDRSATSGALKSKADKPTSASSLLARKRATVVTQGPRAGMATKKSMTSLKHKIKSGLAQEAYYEEVEQIDELKTSTVRNYLQKAKSSSEKSAEKFIQGNTPDERKPHAQTLTKRRKGISMARGKLTGEPYKKNPGVDNTLINPKVLTKEERDTPGNGREHQCAIHVKSEQFGEGKTLTTQHAEPDADGNIAWYDVMFEHGIERVMTEDIEILVSEAHTHSKKKGMM